MESVALAPEVKGHQDFEVPAAFARAQIRSRSAQRKARRDESGLSASRVPPFFSLFSPSTRKGRQASSSGRSANRLAIIPKVQRAAHRAARHRLTRALQSTKQYAACRRADSTSSPSVVVVGGCRKSPARLAYRPASACANFRPVADRSVSNGGSRRCANGPSPAI